MMVPLHRIPLLRPLRPPSRYPSPIRPFTHNSQLLLLASRHTHPRPHLPYLYQSHARRQTLLGPNQQIARLFSNETRQYVREQFWLATKWTAILWTFAGLSFLMYAGYVIETTEHASPTPPEWTFRTRYSLRAARLMMDEETQAQEGRYIDWGRVSSFFETVLDLLEDPKGQGQRLTEVGVDGEVISIPGVGKADFDISEKSWAWRSGYFEAVMGCALAAEHLQGKVWDKTTGGVYDREFVIGPSNPDSRPKTIYMDKSPREEDITDAAAPPETFYMRILTGRGFTTRQRMDAARAYANWLDIKGLADSAEEMYRWSLDVAMSALPTGLDPDSIIDSKTAVIKQGDAARNEITPNLLRAATDMAIHHARNNNVSAALPILLSVLRARRAAPISPFPAPAPARRVSALDMGAMITAFFRGSQFPPPPPSGDVPFLRDTDQPTCEESELMLYIGEILYATSPAADEGLGWTRQAVTIAETNLAMLSSPFNAGANEATEVKKCKECLETGVTNWDAMLRSLSDEQVSAADAAKKSWFSWGGAKRAEQKLAEFGIDRKRVDVLRKRIAREGLEEQASGMK